MREITQAELLQRAIELHNYSGTELYQKVLALGCGLFEVCSGILFLKKQRSYISLCTAGKPSLPSQVSSNIFPKLRGWMDLKSIPLSQLHTTSLQNHNPTSTATLIPLGVGEQQFGLVYLEAPTDVISKIKPELLQILSLICNLVFINWVSNQKSNQALTVRDELLSLTLHDLRTPITTISGFIQLIDKKNKNNQSIDQKWLDILQTETHKLNYHVQKLHYVSQLLSKNHLIPWEVTSVHRIITDLVTRINTLFPKIKVVLNADKLDSQTFIVAYAPALVQAFTSIVEYTNFAYTTDTILNLKTKKVQRGVEIQMRISPHTLSATEIKTITTALTATHTLPETGEINVSLARVIFNQHNTSVTVKVINKKILRFQFHFKTTVNH